MKAKVRVALALGLAVIPFVARPALPVFAACYNTNFLNGTDRGISDPGNGRTLGDVSLWYVHCDSGDWYHARTYSGTPGTTITSIDQEQFAQTAGPQTYPIGLGTLDSPGGVYSPGITFGRGIVSSVLGNGTNTTPTV